MRLAQEAYPLWRELEAECGRALLDQPGTLDLGDWQANRDALAACGVAVRGARRRRDRATLPDSAEPGESGLFQPDGGIVFADLALQAFRDSAEAAGADVRERLPVDSVQEDGDGVVAGGVRARVAVVTAGAWAPALVGVDATPTRETTSYFSLDEPVPSVIDGGPGGTAAMRSSRPGVGLKAGVHQSGPVADPDEPGEPDAEHRRAGRGVGGAAVPPAPVRSSRMETCLYTNRLNDEFVLAAQRADRGRLALQRPRLQVRAGHRQAARRAGRGSALAEEVSLGRDDEVAAGALAAQVEPAHDRCRVAVGLAHHELGGARELVGDRDLGRLKLVADAVALAGEVEQRRDAGDPERHVGRALPEGPAEGVADDHADVAPGARRRPSRIPAADASGSSGSRTSVPSPFAFDASTPAEAQTKPCRVSAMTSGGRERTTRALSRRIASTWRGSRSPASSQRPLGRLDLVEPDDAALRLRDDLLRDDDDVGVLEPSGAVGRVRQERDEIVALLDLRDALEREDPDLGRHWSPVTRTPACAL